MLILYDKNHNKSSPLTFAKNPKVERELPSGMETLSFYYPERKAHKLKPECYLRTKKQEFVIKEINNQTSQWLYVVAKVNTESIKGKAIENYEVVNATITDAINLCLTGTGWTLEYTDIVRRRTVRKSNCNSEDVLDNIRSTFRAEFMFDAINKRMYAFDMLGEDKGVYFSDELNLKKLTLQSHTYDFCTKIIPIGKDGIKISNVNGGIEYIENHQYSDKIITMIWEDNRYTDPEALKEDATVKLAELSTPMNAYLADIYDLAKMNPKYKNILDYSLGDTITLVDKETRVKEKHRIIKTTEYLDEPELNSCEIANRLPKFENMQNNFLDATETLRTVTTSDGLIDDHKINLDPIRQEFGQIVAEKADFTDLQAATARIGTLEVTSATITQLDTEIARINDLYTIKASITELTAAVGRISILESDVASIDTILAKQVFAELAEFGQIRAGSGIIAEGAIGSAQISDLSASKLTAGIVNAAIVTIQGTDGRLKIANNRLQVFSGTTQLFERVALGDVNGDGTEYGLLVRGADGQTTLFDHNGLTDQGFTGGYNRLDDNSLNPVKLDIAQVVTRINEGTTTIESSKIYMDNKTLDVAISTIESTVNTHGQSISSQGAQITALDSAIQLKVDTQTYTSDLENINSQLSTQSGAISVLQNEIALKVTQTDINNAVNPLDTRISFAEGQLSVQSDQIQSKVNQADYNGNVITSLINQTATTIDIIAEKIRLQGGITIQTYIDHLGDEVNLRIANGPDIDLVNGWYYTGSEIHGVGVSSDVQGTVLRAFTVYANNAGSCQFGLADQNGDMYFETINVTLAQGKNRIEVNWELSAHTQYSIRYVTGSSNLLVVPIASIADGYYNSGTFHIEGAVSSSTFFPYFFNLEVEGNGVTGIPLVGNIVSSIVNGTYKGGTFINETTIYSPTVVGLQGTFEDLVAGIVNGARLEMGTSGTLPKFETYDSSNRKRVEILNDRLNIISPTGSINSFIADEGASFKLIANGVPSLNMDVYRVAIGRGSAAEDNWSTVVGSLSAATGGGIAIGANVIAENGAIAIGRGSQYVIDGKTFIHAVGGLLETDGRIEAPSITVNGILEVSSNGAIKIGHAAGANSHIAGSPTAGRQWLQIFAGGATTNAGSYISLYGSSDSTAPGVIIMGSGTSNAFRLDASQNARFYGNISVDGTKAATVETKSYGKREMYALETPDNRFVAYIEKNLPEGENWIEICPMFIETISSYFIVPHVQNASDVIILERHATKFRVWVFGHRAEVVFEINGKRKGFENIYMEPVKEEEENNVEN